MTSRGGLFPHEGLADDEESEASDYDFLRPKAMDAVEEAWGESRGTLCLRNVQIDQYVADFLVQRLEAVRLEQKKGKSRKMIRKIVLDRCHFSGEHALNLMIVFINKLGQELSEISIMDASERPGLSTDRRLVCLLGGLQYIGSLTNLTIERADLRGRQNGYNLRYILAMNADLNVLHLFGCLVDDAMYEQFLIGVQYHLALRYVDVGGWRLNDKQLERLVDALVYSASNKQLKYLDISGSAIGEDSLQSLTRLLNECEGIEELILSSCDNLFSNAKWESPKFCDFVRAMNSRDKLRNVAMSKRMLSPPLYKVLDANTTLHVAEDLKYAHPATQSIVPSSDKTTKYSSYCGPLSIGTWIMESAGLSFMLCRE